MPLSAHDKIYCTDSQPLSSRCGFIKYCMLIWSSSCEVSSPLVYIWYPTILDHDPLQPGRVWLVYIVWLIVLNAAIQYPAFCWHSATTVAEGHYYWYTQHFQTELLAENNKLILDSAAALFWGCFVAELSVGSWWATTWTHTVWPWVISTIFFGMHWISEISIPTKLNNSLYPVWSCAQTTTTPESFGLGTRLKALTVLITCTVQWLSDQNWSQKPST